MRHISSKISASCLVAACLLGSAVSASALVASQSIQKETTIITEDGTTQVVRTAADTVVPGERIVYTINYTNDKAEAVNDIVLTLTVPPEVTFVEGSADKAGAVVSYSTDNGASFTSRQSAMVMETGGNIRAASADDITAVRWTVAGPVAAGVSDALSFSANLK